MLIDGTRGPGRLMRRRGADGAGRSRKRGSGGARKRLGDASPTTDGDALVRDWSKRLILIFLDEQRGRWICCDPCVGLAFQRLYVVPCGLQNELALATGSERSFQCFRGSEMEKRFRASVRVGTNRHVLAIVEVAAANEREAAFLAVEMCLGSTEGEIVCFPHECVEISDVC